MSAFLWLLPYFLVGIEIGLLSGTVGTYIHTRRLSSIVGGLSHFLLGPIGFTFIITDIIGRELNISFFSMICMVLVAFLLPIDSTGKTQSDNEIQILWSLGMAFGLLVMSLVSDFLNLDSFLMGSLLTISNENIIFISIISFFVLTIEFFFHNRFKYLGIDDDFIRIRGINPRLYHRLQLIIIVITISILLEAVGILLMIAILTIPSAIASLLVLKNKLFLIFSISISIISLMMGILLSYVLDLPISPTIALLLCICYYVLKTIQYVKQR